MVHLELYQNLLLEKWDDVLFWTQAFWNSDPKMFNHKCVKFRFSMPGSGNWVSRTWESAFSVSTLDNSDEGGLWITFEEHLLIIT